MAWPDLQLHRRPLCLPPVVCGGTALHPRHRRPGRGPAGAGAVAGRRCACIWRRGAAGNSAPGEQPEARVYRRLARQMVHLWPSARGCSQDFLLLHCNGHETLPALNVCFALCPVTAARFARGRVAHGGGVPLALGGTQVGGLAADRRLPRHRVVGGYPCASGRCRRGRVLL